MSKIALTPNASGTGTFTIASPNSNSDRTVTLPDASGTLNTSGAANEVPAGSAGSPAIYPTGDTNTGIFFPAADTIAFSEGGVESMRIDASGNLGIGTSSPARRLEVSGAGSGETYQLRLGAGNSNPSFTYDIGRSTVDGLFRFYGNQTGFTGYIFGGVDGERARIDSNGNLLINTTTAGDGKVRISASANLFNILKIDDTGSVAGNYVQFLNSAGSQAGAINHSGTTSVSYNSGSDYRLKNIIGPVTNAIGFINSLKPKVGTWKEDGSKFVGFLAHEFAEVCPQAVQGEKDAVDADGKPLYQSMEASSPEVIANIVSLLQEQQALIATLTAAIQELKVIVDAQGAEIAALKGTA